MKRPAKVIIQIPCYNEAAFIGVTLKALPRELDGCGRVEWLVIDDGSTDGTAEAARACGADHVVRLPKNGGLARAFTAGLEACLRLGADIIVNTDADNQYQAGDIAALVAPVREGRADIVVGARPITQTEHFSPAKKLLQLAGSWVVRLASRTDLPDAPSGFRAMSREAAMRLNVFSSYTYTLETIIQAGQKGMAIVSVPVRTNAPLRPSRLLKSVASYVWRSFLTIVRIFVVYKPFWSFVIVGVALFSAGVFLGARFIYYAYIVQDHTQRIQSLILAAILMGMGFQTMLTAFLADLLSVNRRLLEDLQYRAKDSGRGRGGADGA